MITQTIVEEDSMDKRRLLAQLSSQILRGKDRFPPKPSNGFFVSDADWRQCTLNVHLGAFCLLIGPSGSGKTELVGFLSQAMKRSLHSFAFGGILEPRLALIGAKEFDPKKGTYFAPSRFIHAIQVPQAIIRLDEINRCDAFTTNVLFSLLDNKQRSIDIDENGTVVKVHDTVSFFGTANLGFEYVGANKIDRALLDRADIIIRVSFPPPEVETKVLLERTGITKKNAELLVTIANEQRLLAQNHEFAHGLSTRRLLCTAQQLALGVPLTEAVSYTLTSHFSEEGGASSDSSRFKQLLQKFGL